MPYGPEEIDLPVRVTEEVINGAEYSSLTQLDKGVLFLSIAQKILEDHGQISDSEDPFEQLKQYIEDNNIGIEEITTMRETAIANFFSTNETDPSGKVFFGNDSVGYYQVGKRNVDAQQKTVTYAFDKEFVDEFLTPLNAEISKLQTIQELKALKVNIGATVAQRDVLEQGIDLPKLQQTLNDDLVAYNDLIQKFADATTKQQRDSIQQQIDALMQKDQYLLSFLYADPNVYVPFIVGWEEGKQELDTKLGAIPVLSGTVITNNDLGNNDLGNNDLGNNDLGNNDLGNNDLGNNDLGNNDGLEQQQTSSLDAIKKTKYTSADQLAKDCGCLPENERPTPEHMQRINGFVDCLVTSGLSGQEAMEALRMLCTTEAQWTYYYKYLEIKQQFNENNISKAQAVKQTIQAEDQLNRTELSKKRQARRLRKQAGNSMREQLAINKDLRKALICDLQAEALEAQNKWMLDMMACVESRNIGTNPLPTPSFVKRCPDMLSILNDPNSAFRTNCRSCGYTRFDELGRDCNLDDLQDLMNGLDLGSDRPGCPALCSQTYPIRLAARTPDNANGSGRVDYGPNGEIMPVRETFDNTLLIGEFVRFVKAKEEGKLDFYDNGWKPLFQEVALRHLTSKNKFDFYEQIAGAGWPREKLDLLLQDAIYSLVDDAVVSDMRQRYKGYHESFKDNVPNQHKVLGGVFLDSLINQHLSGATEHRINMQGKLLNLRGGRRTAYNNEPEGNEAVGEKIFNHVKNLPDPKYGGSNYGGEQWLTKPLEVKDYAFLPNGARGGANRMIDMTIRNSLVSLGVSPQHASEVGAVVKMGGMVLLGIGAWKLLKSVYKGKDGSGGWRGVGRLAMLGAGLYILPRALFNRDLGSLWNYGWNGDPKNKGLFPNGYSALMKKFGAEADRKTPNKDVLTHTTTVNSFFCDLKFKDLAKYVKREGGKYRMTPQSIQDFLNAPESEVSEYAKRMFAIHFQSLGNSHNAMSDLINAGLAGAGCSSDYDHYKKRTDDPAFSEMTFGQLASTNAEINRFSDMFGELFEDSQKKQEFSQRFATLDAKKKEEVTERIEKVKEFDRKRQERVPYVNHLLQHRQELFTNGQSPLDGIDATKHNHLLTGLQDYATKHGSLKLDFFKGNLTKPTYEEIVLDQFDDSVDSYVKRWLFDESGGFDALKKYEYPAGTDQFDQKFSIDAMNNKWQLGNIGTTGGTATAQKELLYKGNVESNNKDFFMSISDTYKWSVWVKGDDGKFQEYVLEQIHDYKDFKLEGVGMNIEPNGKKTFKIKYPKSAGYETEWSDFDAKFLGGIVENLTKGVTDFKVPEERLDSGTQPHWIRDKTKKGIWNKLEFDPMGKLFGPSVIFKKTENKRP